MRSFALLMMTGALIAAPVLAQTTTAPAATPAVAVASGAKVVDTAGAAVGTIDSVAGGVAVLNTGAVKVSVPVTSFATGPTGPIIALTKSEIEAKAAAAAQSVTITVGATVNDTTGAKVGTVKAVAGDRVTVASATANAQLPKSAFASGDGGALVIGMSAAQFDAAAKAAGGAKPGA